MVPEQSLVPTLDDGFALMKALYDAGYGVEFMAGSDPAVMSVSMPLKGMREKGGSYDGIEDYPWWGRLQKLVEPHGVKAVRARDAIDFRTA